MRWQPGRRGPRDPPDQAPPGALTRGLAGRDEPERRARFMASAPRRLIQVFHILEVAMSATEAGTASRAASVGRVDMKLEIQVIPVSDVDRSKEFYERAGWRLDDDVAPMDGLRIVQ